MQYWRMDFLYLDSVGRDAFSLFCKLYKHVKVFLYYMDTTYIKKLFPCSGIYILFVSVITPVSSFRTNHRRNNVLCLRFTIFQNTSTCITFSQQSFTDELTFSQYWRFFQVLVWNPITKETLYLHEAIWKIVIYELPINNGIRVLNMIFQNTTIVRHVRK